MEQLGTDFNATGSVMSRAELEEQRRKRGECITCGRKCFVKKLFKMIPITDHGRVLNGRCLNCHPLDATDGALPAVSRPATEADLARFTRSQNNLRGSITQSSPNAPPPPEQRQLSRNQQMSRNVSQSNMSHSTSTQSSGSQRHAMAQRQSVTSYTSASGESLGSGGGGSSLAAAARGAAQLNMDNQSISSRNSSRERNPSPLLRNSNGRNTSPLLRNSNSSSGRTTSSGLSHQQQQQPTRPETTRANSARSMPYQHSSSAPSSSLGVLVSQHEINEAENEEHSYYSTNDDATYQSGTSSNAAESALNGRDYYHRSYHSSRSMGSQGSDSSPIDGPSGLGNATHTTNSIQSNIDFGGNKEPTYNSTRRSRRAPSHENSYNGLPSSRRRPSAERVIRRSSDDSLNARSLHGQSRRASSFDHISEEDRISLERAFGNSAADTSTEARRRSSHSAERYNNSRDNTSIRPNHSNADLQDLILQQQLLQSMTIGNTVKGNDALMDGQHNMLSSRDMEGSGRRNETAELDAFQYIRNAGNNFLEILKCMQDHQNSIEVQTFALQTISNIELTDVDCMLLSSVGVIQMILDTMDGFPEDIELQVSGCRAIWNTSGTPDNQRAFVEFGAIDVVLRTISTFSNNTVIQEQALAVLANLGANEDNLEKIVQSGAIERLIETLGKHASNADVQVKGCLAISNFASHPIDYTKKIVSSGGGSAIVVSMVLHPNNAELQERALRALRNLSANVDQNRVELTNIGGIDAIISAMQVHRDSADIQQIGAWTLSNLAGNEDVRTLIGDCGGIDVIIRAMWVHNDKVPVQEWCSRALYSLSSSLRNSKMILELGGVSAIVNAMQAHVDAVAVQEMGCSVLCNLATDQQSKMRIVDEEALDAVVLAMVLFSDDAKVQQHSCQLLLQLAIAENFKAMQASNVGELVVAASRKFPDTCAVPAERLIKVIEGFLAEYL